jgi:hypothetical protein
MLQALLRATFPFEGFRDWLCIGCMSSGRMINLPVPVEMECEDDHLAIVRAARYHNEHGMELWTLARVVKIFPRPEGGARNGPGCASFSERVRLFREHWLDRPPAQRTGD